MHFLPEGSAEVPDEQSARVVVLGPEHTHRTNNTDSTAMKFITEIMNSRGNSPRHHRNMLVFIAPDETRNNEWEESIRKYLAWKSIERDREVLNLDAQQSRQVAEAIKRESETVDKRLQETYCWLIVPKLPKLDEQKKIDLQREMKRELEYEQERLSGSDEFLQRAARKLKNNEWLIDGLSPDNLLMELEPLDIWKQAPHLSIKTLWDWLTNYCYLPRLFDRSVLEETIKEGVNRIGPAFGYATRVKEGGGYDGLKWQQSFPLFFDDNEVIVQPDVARAQREAELAAQQKATPSMPVSGGSAPDVSIPVRRQTRQPRQSSKHATTAQSGSKRSVPCLSSARLPTKSSSGWKRIVTTWKSQLRSTASAQRASTTPPCAPSAKTAVRSTSMITALKTKILRT